MAKPEKRSETLRCLRGIACAFLICTGAMICTLLLVLVTGIILGWACGLPLMTVADLGLGPGLIIGLLSFSLGISVWAGPWLVDRSA